MLQGTAMILDVYTLNTYLSGCRTEQSCNGLECCALTCTVRAQQPHELTFRDIEAYIRHRCEVSVGLHQMGYFDIVVSQLFTIIVIGKTLFNHPIVRLVSYLF